MKNILPEWIFKQLEQKYKLDDIQELRIRQDKPIQICYKGKYLQIKNNEGLYQDTVIANKSVIDFIISSATKNSLYAYEEQIKNGFIVTENGIRIGLCGTAVMRNGEITFMKNVSSVNLRFAHRVSGCSKQIINYIISNSIINNTLIISEPGAGKTTLIRDVVEQMSKQFNIPNILVIDEKYELAGENKKFNLGDNVDLMQGSNKKFGFYEAIKVMNPNVIVTDELISNEDIEGVKFAVNSGVKIIATAHAKTIEQIKEKEFIKDLIKENCFDRFIVLSKRNGVGTIEAVFNNKFQVLLM